MKAIDVGALSLMGAALYVGCAMAGVWWRSGTPVFIAAFILLFAAVIAYERGFLDYWKAGYKTIFLIAFVLPVLLGSVGFAYGLFVG